MPNDGTESGMQSVMNQANAAIKNGKNVVAAVNGNFYDMATGEAQGCIVKNGVEIHPSDGSNFFGVTNNGTAIIGDDTQYQQIKTTLKAAMSGNDYIVKDKKINDVTAIGANKEPRTAVGLKADNSVFFVVIDGRQEGYSGGISMPDLAQLMLDMGAVQALNLDGGGSSTYVSRTPGDDQLSLKNKPSDGNERGVANTWLVVSKATATHTFASAYVTPYDKSFTPGSTISFGARGVDSSGASAVFPQSGLTWSLSDSSFGTIDASTGVFKSNSKTGQVQAQVSYNGKVVGSTYVEIAVPDDIHFIQSKMSLAPGQTQALGLVVKYQGRDVEIKKGDIAWNISSGLGTMDDNNVFIASSNQQSGTVTATLNGTSLSSNVNIQVGQVPYVIQDFEDITTDNSFLNTWDFDNGGRGETASLGSSTYPDEPARFGNHAAKLNFDFTTGEAQSTLVTYIGPKTKAFFPGVPTAVGMWVYATPESQGEWLYMELRDSNGKGISSYITTDINWTGWKYVETKIPDGYTPPYRLATYDAIGVLCVKSGMNNGSPMTKGSIYVDNVRAVYGFNNDDLYPPIVDSVDVDGKTYTSQNVNISAAIHDDASDKYESGINWDRAKILVDGKDYSTDKSHFSYDKDGKVNLSGLSWSDGIHKVTTDIQDNFGNETTKDSYFTINAGNNTKVELVKGGDSAPLGGTYKLKLVTNNSADVKKITAQINIGKNFPVTNVEFGADEAGSTYSYDSASGNLTLSIVNSSAQTSDTVGTIDISVPSGSPEKSHIDYSVLNSKIEYKEDKGAAYCPTFSCMPGTIPVVSGLTVTVTSAIVGKDGEVFVTDSNGKPVLGAAVTMTVDGQDTVLGQTDKDGKIISSALTDSVKNFILGANKDDQYSFSQTGQSYTPFKDKIPSNILAGTTTDPSTQKSFSWMTNPITGKASAVMQAALKTDYTSKGEAAFKNIIGQYKNIPYSANGDLSSSGIVRKNNVTAAGLIPGETYSYRVGDGTNWSDVREFTTMEDKSKFSFNVFGDTQVGDASQLTDFETMINSIENSPEKPAFSIHVGDFTDDAQRFDEIDETASMLSKHPVFDSIDMVHVLGNHEYMGDDGTKAKALFSTPTNGPKENIGGCYSTDYGNMHIAVIGWTDNETLMKAEIDWLKQDMKASTKTWKVVATHQPVYNTNPEDSSTLFSTLTPVCDELGIDVVFSGHDHAYGRTKGLKNGIETKGGTIYIGAGTTGPKHYNVNNDGKSWDKLDDSLTDKVYITCQVDNGKLGITAKTTDGTVVDQFTEEKDVTAPVIKLLGNDNVTVANGAAYKDEGASAVDDKDGDITAKIIKIITNSAGITVTDINTTLKDTYTIHYNVSDAAGNKAAEVTRKVVVQAAVPVPTTVTVNVVDSTTNKEISAVSATVTNDSNGNAAVSMNAAKAIVMKQPNGNISTIADLSKVVITTANGTPIPITSDGKIELQGLAKGTDNKFEISYDLGNGQKIVIGSLGIKIASDGTVTITDELIDPYGTITDAAAEKPISGANVILYYANTDKNKASGKIPDTIVSLPGISGFMPNNNKNPQLSDGSGTYGYMVYPDSDYYVVATKEGYNKYTSPTISVGKEVVKWDIKMTPIKSAANQTADNTGSQNSNQTTASGTSDKKLVKTGSIIDSSVLMSIGALLIVSGSFIVFRRRKTENQ